MTEIALHAALVLALSERCGAPVQVAGLHQLAGGASKEIWQLDLDVAAGQLVGRHELVLLRQLGGKIKADALDLAAEYRALAVAHAAGVPTPRPFLLFELQGAAAVLVQRLPGEAIGRRVVREARLAAARAKLPGELGAALAAIHQIDIDATGLRAALPGPAQGLSPAAYAIAQIEADLDRIGEPHPAIELGLRWLRRRLPPDPARLTLVHGDFRVGNLLVTPDGLAGVLDWEFAHVGDPYEDLAWPLLRDWRFGQDHLRLGGVGAPADFFAAYAASGGLCPDLRIVQFWEVLGNLRWATGCLNQAERHLSGQEPNLEFASLGRRAAEMELEALMLIRAADGAGSA